MPTVFTPRPYQSAGGDAIQEAFRRGKRRACYVLPTAGGKSYIFSRAAQQAAAKGKSVCIMGHRQEIVDQISATLSAMDVAHGVIAAGRTATPELVQVAMVQTLARRLHRYPHFDLIVTDECHHAVSPTYMKILSAYPDAYSLGTTASPERLDGKGLGEAFDEMIIGPSVAELTAMGYLCPSVVYAPPGGGPDLSKVHTKMGDYDTSELESIMSNSVIVGDAIAHYKRLCSGLPAIVFCVSVKHSKQVAAEFLAAGVRAAHVDGDTERGERRRLIQALASGEMDVLTNCSLLTEGLDIVRLGAVVLLRPTQSLALWLQMVGRALRPYAGKARAMILDHANCTGRFGFPDDKRDWSLDGRAARKKKNGDSGPPLRQCPSCYKMLLAQVRKCDGCGHVFDAAGRDVQQIDGELVELDRDEWRKQQEARDKRRQQGRAQTLEELIALGKSRGYSHPHAWAKRLLAARKRA